MLRSGRYSDSQGGQRVVGVLFASVQRLLLELLPTMNVCIKELMNVNIQIGGDMYRIPDHIANIAPA